jgi:FkbM family methyltransferase
MLKTLIGRAARAAGLQITRYRGTFGGIPISSGPLFDVGAHLGDTIAEMRALKPLAEIYAFEPFPEFNSRLRQRYSNDEKVSVHEIALSDHSGEASLITSNLNLSLTGPLKASGEDNVDSIVVPVRTLDDISRELGVSHISLLKIDAEGHDLAILKGASALLDAKAIDVLVVEVMFVELFIAQPLFNSIYEYMNEKGYTLFDIRQVKKAQNGQSRYANAVFVLT